MRFQFWVLTSRTAMGVTAMFVTSCLAGVLLSQENRPFDFTDAELEFFESKVRPILVDRCNECHGPESDHEGELSVASRQDMLRGGGSGPLFIPKAPHESLLIESINYAGEYEMPPDSKLPDNEIEILTKWIELGAPWPSDSDIASANTESFDLEKRKSEHWCWQPRTNPAPPEIASDSWSQLPLDKFVLEKIRANKLQPNDRADKRSLIRRLYFDVTGLPPTAEQVEQFISDESENAFEKVVDNALASPRFGEHWGRHWMDLTRYAETGGHEFDYPIPDAWQYRDYLIRAFNADVAYDQVIREHIAGDLIQTPRQHPEESYNESMLGTGFWYLHEAVHGPVDVRADRADRVDNQIDVMSKTFLGMTVACARCHDHKFDAISAEDYYAMFGYLKSSRRQSGMLDPNNKIATAAKVCRAALANVDDAQAEVFDWLANTDRKMLAKHFAAIVEFVQEKPGWNNKANTKLNTDKLFPIFKTESGTSEIQKLKPIKDFKWEDDSQIWWRDAKVGDKFSFEFDAMALAPVIGRECEIFTNYTTASDYGKVKVSFNGKVLKEELDFYTQSLKTSGRVSLGVIKIEGTNRMEFEALEPNDRAIARNMVGIDYLEFVATEVNSEKLVDRLSHFVESHDQYKKDDLNIDFLHDLAFGLESQSANDPVNPINGFVKISKDKQWQPKAEAENKKIREAVKKSEKESVAFADFRNGIPDDWYVTGSAFDAPRDSAEQPQGAVSSGRHGNKFYGVLRSPTFTIENEKIFYRVQGSGCSIRLIIDGFVMDIYNGLLFKGCRHDINSPTMSWVTKAGDINNYLGHEAHIEIIDHGEGSFAIEEIRFGNNGPPPEPATHLERLARKLNANNHSTSCRKLLSDMFEVGDKNGLTSLQHRLIVDFFADNNLSRHLPQKVGLNNQPAPVEKFLAAKNVLNAASSDVSAPMFCVAMADGDGRDEKIYVRGNHKTLGETAKRNFLTALSETPPPIEKGSGRLELAEKIASPDNPLTARVAVNRIWHHMLGVGIVPSVDNFGVLGQKPTHPELLDYLANELIEEQWSIKKMIRRIALSKTYQLATKPNSSNLESDPNNKWLHAAHVKRLTGESIRDTMLLVSGQLNEKQFGPPVKIHLNAFMQGRGRPGKSGPLDGDRRRSVYVEVRRNFLSPMLLAFDTPIPFNTVGRRNKSNVPAQALVLMNSPFVIEQAKHWAEKTIADDAGSEEKINNMYLHAFGRPANETEMESAIAFIDQQTMESDEATAWRDYCHVLFNTKEFIYIK